MSEDNAPDGTESFIVTSSDAPAPAEVQEVETPTPESTDEVSEEVKTEIEPAVKEGEVVIGDDPPAEEVKSEKKNGTQKRIDKLTRQREDEKRRSESLQRKLDELENKAAEPIAPKEDDFEDYETYLDAKDKFDKAPAEKKEPEQEDKQTDSQKTAKAIIQERYDSAEDKPKDFDAVALSDEVGSLVTDSMMEAMSECEDTLGIMYSLGKDINLAKSISEMSPTRQMIAIAKLDKKPAPKKPVQTSKTAPPISPVKGSDTPTKKSLQDQSYSEYEKTRNKQEAKRKHW